VRGHVLAAAAACFGVAAQAQAAPPPASAFGRIPAVVDAEISPDGQHVAILGGTADHRLISIATVDSSAMPRLDLGEVETINLRWAGNEHVLATVAYWQKQSSMIAYRVERHISVNTQAQAVARFLNTGTNGWWYRTGQPILQITSEANPHAVVLDLAGTGAGIDGIWLVDPATGKGKLVERGESDTYGWDVDRSGEPRVRLDSGRTMLWARPKGSSQWKPLLDKEAGKETHFLGYTEPEDGIYLEKDSKIVLRHLADGSVQPFADVEPGAQLVWDQHRNTAVGIASGGERPSYRWLDPDLGAAHSVLSRAFKGLSVELHSWSQDRSRILARVASPGSPGAWYLYDRARKEVSPIADEYPELKGASLGATQWISYKASDGLEIHAYFTPPAGVTVGNARSPLVVLPHGGPASRDTFDFDFMAQFLASRGYAVLQPQFRGSAGFGEAFEKAGQGEWAGKMQTDLLDGVRALAESGKIDPKRVCIVGASFGGYAALASAAFHVGEYRCAASIAGIGDLWQLTLEDTRLYGPDSGTMKSLKEMLGGSSRERLVAGSPALHAYKIDTPILLIHGDKDTVVRIEQSQRMAEALKLSGKAYEYVVLKDENHYLTKSATRTQTLEVLERFLAKNLPVN